MDKIYTWSNDRECWIGEVPRGHTPTTHPKQHLFKVVNDNKPSSVLDEWTTDYQFVPPEVLLGTVDENLYN